MIIHIARFLCVSLTAVLFCMVLSTVFVINNQLANGVIAGKYFWFYISIGLTSVAVILSVAIHKRTLRFSLLDGLVAVFCGCGLWVTYYHTGEMTTKWVLLLLLLILYFYFRIVFVQHKGYLPLLIFFLIITGLVEAVWGLRQLYGFSHSQHGLFKITGSFFNPGPYAGYLAVVFPVALYYWVKGTQMTRISTDNKLKESQYTSNSKEYNNPCQSVLSAFKRINAGGRYIAGATCVAIVLVLPAAMSRASWLAAIGGSLLVGFDYLRRRVSLQHYYSQYKKKIWMAGIVGIILFGMALAGAYHLKKDSADGRALMWKGAFRAIPHHPWGVGLHHFSGAYGEEQALYFASGQASEQEEFVAGSPEYGFNEYLQLCIEWGIFPFLLFLGIIVRTVYTGYKRQQIALTSALIALLIFAGMSYPFSVLPFAIVLVFLLAAIDNRTRMKQITRICADKSKKSALIRVIRVPLFGLLLTAFCLYNRYPAYDAYKQWNTKRIYYNARLYQDVAKDYAVLYPLLNDQIQFLFEYAQSLSKSEQYTESNEVLKKAVRISCDPMLYNIMGKNHQALKEYERAEACFIKASNITPNRLYPFYLLTKLYHEMGLQDKVNEMAGIVQTKEPKVQSMAVKEMREEVRRIVNYEL